MWLSGWRGWSHSLIPHHFPSSELVTGATAPGTEPELGGVLATAGTMDLYQVAVTTSALPFTLCVPTLVPECN